MKIKELKDFISDLPDDMEVVIPGYDHSYVRSYAFTANAEKYLDYLGEYYGGDLDKNSSVIKVLVIGQ